MRQNQGLISVAKNVLQTTIKEASKPLREDDGEDTKGNNNLTISTMDGRSTSKSTKPHANYRNDGGKLVIRVAVGSQNPCKVDAVKLALQRAIGRQSGLDYELQIQGFSVPSGVPDQPFGDVG